MNRGVFITGTDTGIGKTLISTLLLSALHQNFKPVTYFKPVQTGSDDDTTTVNKLTGLELCKPVYKYPQPISPHWAASLNNDEIHLDAIRDSFIKYSENRFVITEGAGGLLVPLNSRQTMRDLAHHLELPVIVVSSTRLGTINHTLLTLEAARAQGLNVLGVVLTGGLDEKLVDTLSVRGKTAILASIPIFEVTSENIKIKAAEFFSPLTLEKMVST